MSLPALRLGIVGFGRLAREYYLPALRTIPGVDVVAVADPLEASRTAALARLRGVRIHADHRTMLERDALDGLLVASPPSTHLAVLDDAAAGDHAIFLEKPVVLSGQLDELVRRGAPRRLMLDFNRRFWRPYRDVAERVQSGALGRPVEVDFLLHVDVLAWCTVTRHRFSPDEGGAVHDLGSQAIDLALELMGAEPRAIAAETRTLRWDGDHVRMEIAFADGSRVRCDLAYAARTRERVVVSGPAGTVRLNDPNMAVRSGRDGALAGRARDLVTFAGRALAPARRFARSSIRDALAAFASATRGQAPFVPGADDALRNARWVAAAVASAGQRGRP